MHTILILWIAFGAPAPNPGHLTLYANGMVMEETASGLRADSQPSHLPLETRFNA